MVDAVLSVDPRVVAVHLSCQCCGDRIRFAISDDCQHYDRHLLAPATLWVDGHLAPHVTAVELLLFGRRRLLTEHDL